MYTKTKLFTLGTILSVLSILFSSCGQSVTVNDTESMATLGAIVKEHLEADVRVKRIFISCSTSSYTGWGIQSISFNYTNANGEHRELFLPIEGTGNKSDRPSKTPAGKVDVSAIISHAQGISGQKQETATQDTTTPKVTATRVISDYDYSQIAKNIQESMKMAHEAGAPATGVNTYSISLYSDPARDEHSWTLMSKASDTKLEGRKMVTEYYQLQFAADGNGKVTMVD